MKRYVSTLFLIATLFFVLFPTDTGASKTWTSFSNVSIDKEWKISFSKAIDENSTANNVYITKGTTKLPVQIEINGTVLQVKPKELLDYNTSYTVVVNENVQDRTGKRIKNAIIIPFTTEKKSSYITKARETFSSEYEMNWYLTDYNYHNFHLKGFTNSKEVGLFDTRKNYTFKGIQIGKDTISSVKKKYGQPIKSIPKGNTLYLQSYKDKYGQETHGTYVINEQYVTFFYDVHQNNIVRSIYSVTKDIEATKPGFYRKDVSIAYRNSLEQMMAHLINESRVAAGLKPLTYTPTYNEIARAHSSDMATKNYFSHTDSSGKTVLKRAVIGGLDFKYIGENIAKGQYSSIFAHEALMNSIGHRQNILSKNYTHVIVGVAFNSDNLPYYTINFYSK